MTIETAARDKTPGHRPVEAFSRKGIASPA